MSAIKNPKMNLEEENAMSPIGWIIILAVIFLLLLLDPYDPCCHPDLDPCDEDETEQSNTQTTQENARKYTGHF